MDNDALLQEAKELVAILPEIMQLMFTLDTEDPALELPIGQLRVCLILRRGPRTMSSLSRSLGITLSAITQIADRLERAGLVERAPQACDRRVKTLRLTQHGEETLRCRDDARTRRALEVLAHLGSKERDALLLSLRDLLSACIAVTPEDLQECATDEELTV